MEKLLNFVLFFTLLIGQANQQNDGQYNEGIIDNQCLNCHTNSNECHQIIEQDRLTFMNCDGDSIEWMAKIIEQMMNVTIIDISNSGLQTINAIDLHQNQQLKKFIAANNKLSKFPSKSFSEAPFIEEIDLSANRLTSIELYTFEGLKTLTTIDLSFNYINYVDENAFSKLDHLANVDLRYNHLEKLGETKFCPQCTVSFNIKGNPLGWQYGSWADLLFIDLREHSIRFRAILDDKNEGISKCIEDGTMEVHCSDQSFKEMLEFSIDRNQMENLPILLQCLGTSIKKLHLSGNYLGSLNRTVFKRFKNLEALIVADTQLAGFDFSLINSRIISLDLSCNGLKSLTNVPTLTKFLIMHDFNVAGNNIQNIHELIRKLPSDSPLFYVADLSDNIIGPLNETTFERFTMVTNFKLRNTRISIMDFDPFKQLRKLYDFDISNNNLDGVNFTVLADTLRKLHFFYASNCQIRNISEVIQYLGEYIAVLDLSNNFGIDLNANLFESFSRLNNLNLSNTNIKHFAPEIFQYLKYINLIDFSNNQLHELDFHLLSHRIQKLYINNNRLQEITNLNRRIFLVPSKLDVAENCLTDGYVTQILRNVIGIAFRTDPFKQKSNEECAKHDSNGNGIWTIIIVVISVAAIIILCVCLVYRKILLYLFVKLKIILKRSPTATEPISNQINQTQSIRTTEIVMKDEPIYEELDEYVKYDKLWHEFQPIPLSKQTQETYNTTNNGSLDAHQ